MKKMKIEASCRFAVSACLAGVKCTHKGKSNCKKGIKRLVNISYAIPVCPEAMGGLTIPRERSEISGGDGSDVLKKYAKVITLSEKDVTVNFVKGANAALREIKQHKIKKAILKSNSPACGVGKIYDGTFGGILKKGNGVFAALLIKNGIKVYTEETAPGMSRK